LAASVSRVVITLRSTLPLRVCARSAVKTRSPNCQEMTRCDTSGALDRILLDFGLRRRIALLVATYLALPAALAASDLGATTRSRTARQIAATAEIEIMPLPIDFSTTVSMA
jgi:hypothetical protein